jgi:hypothetical protein
MKHLRENNETYFNHLRFACLIGVSLMLRGTMFLLHGLFPVVEMPQKFNLEATVEKLSEWNEYTKERMRR